MTIDAYRFRHRSTHAFALPPQQLWTELDGFDRYERWSGWLRDLEVQGGGLEAGTVLTFTVDPPGPLRAALRVELTSCQPGAAVDAAVSGDFEGDARIVLEAQDSGTRATIAWDFRVIEKRLRMAAVTVRPFALWMQPAFAHLTARGFRRHLAETGVA